MSGRGFFWISPCRSSLQRAGCMQQTCSHRVSFFPGNKCTSFPCSRDTLLCFVIIINESAGSSFTSLQGYLRWGFPSQLQRAAGPLGVPLQHPVPPYPHKQTPAPAPRLPGRLWATSAPCWVTHTLLLSPCLVQERISLLAWLQPDCRDLTFFPHMGPVFEQLPLIPKQCFLTKADKFSLQEPVFLKDVLIVCLWLLNSCCCQSLESLVLIYLPSPMDSVQKAVFYSGVSYSTPGLDTVYMVTYESILHSDNC